ncbi:MAG: endonuclease III [Chloroflexi bacterium]|nr:endonuclease III [Chloroflexota bacterium]
MLDANPSAGESRSSAEPGQVRVPKILELLHRTYPDARCSLDFKTSFQLLVATVLSAQCTDERVNLVTPALFARFPTPALMATADLGEVEQIIRSTGFFHNKAKNVVAAARKIAAEFGGNVPATMPELLTIPGVARKTANVVLSNAFGVFEGIAVDTHVARLAQRLGLTPESDPNKIERDLVAIFPRGEWGFVNHALIAHGRAICQARKPLCHSCPLLKLCPTGLALNRS